MVLASAVAMEIDSYAAFTYAAGIAGNLLAFVLFVSPIPTFRRIVRNESTESFSGLPYIYSLLNCLICLWYGLPCLKMSGMLVGVFAVFLLVVYISLEMLSARGRQTFVGYLSVASLISMFASPLFIIGLVIRTRSVEYMPFYLSLSTFLMSISFFVYGLLLRDFFIYIPNGIGAVLGVVQLALYAYYSKTERQAERLPLLSS
ncbi:unnamed protein product [Spirodela intermedia]|uniref:Uncharacterized protein n=1 Tax=Spirodela intermedia TaxID=51605 RepID=A0A7I8ITM8_SPIIN|nr:unnamed protein product [Spirodela intermedia]CAA6661323.1 unnamed protein product [Spirodela intermedia]